MKFVLCHVLNLGQYSSCQPDLIRFESVKLCTKAFFQKRILQLGKH